MYGKFFASAFTGSMYGAGPDVFAVWAYVIANTHDSQVELNPALLAGMLGTTPERVAAAIEFLAAPDPKSRSKTDEGRRLIREGEFAYRVPNYAAYRAIQNEEDRRAYNRQKQAESRQRRAAVKAAVNDSQSQLPMSAQAETEAVAVAEAEPHHPALPHYTSDQEAFEAAWKLYPKRPNNNKQAALRAWRARRTANVPALVLVEGVRRYAAYVASQSVEPRFVKMASTFFGPDEHYLTDFTVPSQSGLSAQERRSVQAGEQFLGEVPE